MKKNQKGITIVELIIYIGLLSIFMLVLIDVFVTILNARLEAESTSTLNQDSRYILARLSYAVKNADSMSLPAGLGGTGSTLRLITGGVTDTYTVDGNGNLNLTSGVVTMKLNGNDTLISNINFTRIGNSGTDNKDTVKVTYTIQSNIKRQAGLESQTVETTLGLR